jgi:hypothetical protein
VREERRMREEKRGEGGKDGGKEMSEGGEKDE